MTDPDSETPSDSDGETVGSRIADDLSTYTSVTLDFYRGEIDRMTTWRGRLDQTTNWAVVVVAAILTWAFSSGDNPHYVILIGVVGTVAFLLMEAHRYREYDVWRDRVRTLQVNLLAEVYASNPSREEDWQADLSDDLREPTFEMSAIGAIHHRLRRSYLALLLLLLIAWIARITVFESSESWRQTASILVIPGEVVIGVVAVFYGTIIGITAWSAREDRTEEFQQ